MSAGTVSVSELFEIASRTHPGLVREANEDHCATFVAEDCVGLVVADGVSSYSGGDTASRLAVQVAVENFRDSATSLALPKRLYRAVQQANIAVHDLALAVPEFHGMATTLTAVALAPGELHAAHVGDCRLYLLRGGKLRQLTKDHTVAAGRMRMGVLSKARARQHPGRSTLTRSLGRELIARVDQLSAPLEDGDLVVVCSDGIHGVLDDSEIQRLSQARSAEFVCQALLEAAHQRGSPDDVTAAAARVTSGARPSVAGKRRLFGILDLKTRR
jgi:serine/threonine protein phosphatase PrpC